MISIKSNYYNYYVVVNGVSSVSASARLSLSQPMCLNLIFGMLSCMFFLCSKFNKDYN